MREPTPTAERRIVLFITGEKMSGAEVQMVRLAFALRQRGWDVHILTLIPLVGCPVEALAAVGITVTTAASSTDRVPGALVGIVRYLRRVRPHVLLTFLFHPNVLGRVLGRLAGVPVVVSSIRSETYVYAWRSRLMRLTDRLASVTTANSHRAATRLVADGVVPPRRLHVVRNALDMALLDAAVPHRDEVRRDLGVRGGWLWIAVGRLEEAKNYPLLVRAFARVRAVHPAHTLAIVGEGSQRAQVEAAIAAAGVQDACTLLGQRADVPRLLAAADAFVLASSFEGMPNVVMEALGAGLPVVATDVGGVRELVDDGRTGFVVPAGDEDALAAAMLEMAALPAEQRQAFGAGGQQAMREQFAPAVIHEAWERLLLGLLDRRKARGGRPRAADLSRG